MTARSIVLQDLEKRLDSAEMAATTGGQSDAILLMQTASIEFTGSLSTAFTPGLTAASPLSANIAIGTLGNLKPAALIPAKGPVNVPFTGL